MWGLQSHLVISESQALRGGLAFFMLRMVIRTTLGAASELFPQQLNLDKISRLR